MEASRYSKQSRDRKYSAASDEDDEDERTWASSVRRRRATPRCSSVSINQEGMDAVSEYAETTLDITANRQTVSQASFTTGSRDLNSPQHRFYKNVCRKLRIIPRTHFLRQIGQPHVSMHNETIDAKELNAICSTLLNDHAVRSLDLGGTVITSKMIDYLAQLLQMNQRITYLVLSEGSMKSPLLFKVVELLTEFKNISQLDLSGNKFDDNDGVLLAKVISEGSSLQYLNLSHNLIREKGAIHLGNAIGSTTSITHLDISWNHVRGRGAECVALGLLENKSVKVLNVSWNGFGFEGCVALAHVLKTNTTLTDLNLTCNRVHPPALMQLLKGLYINRTLLVLRLAKNPIPASYTSAILCIIRDSPEMALQHFDLSGVIVDKEFEVVLEEIAESRDFRCTYEQSLPVHKTDSELNFSSFKSTTVFNIDPVRILFFLKKNLRALDLFNRIDVDGSATITRGEIGNMLKREGLPMSSSALDKIMEFLDTDGDGEVDLREFMTGARRFKRDILEQKALFEDAERMKVEKGDAKSDMNADVGGLGGRFSKTYQSNPEKNKEVIHLLGKLQKQGGKGTSAPLAGDGSDSSETDNSDGIRFLPVLEQLTETGLPDSASNDPGFLSGNERKSNKLFLTTGGTNTPVSRSSSKGGVRGGSSTNDVISRASVSGEISDDVTNDAGNVLPPIGNGQMSQMPH